MFHRCQLIKKNIMLRANSRHLANFFHLVGIPYVVPEIGLTKVTFIQILYCKLFQSQAFAASLFLLSAAPFSQYFFNVILYFHTADNVLKILFLPANICCAARRCGHPSQHVEKGGFSRSIMSQNGCDFIRVNFQIDAFDSFDWFLT